jgi:hypothetical protein
MREHEHDQPTVGTFVDTLKLCIEEKTCMEVTTEKPPVTEISREGSWHRIFEGAPSHLVRVESSSFAAREPVWAYLVGGSFVMLKGVVVGVCPREHEPASGRNMRIARLPVPVRPRRALQFAAMSREAYLVDDEIYYNDPHLVTLIVTPDGWICGVSSKEAEGAIDLSAIRFCVGGGISLVDEVSLHTVDIAGTRMVALQGALNERFFSVDSHKPLALLPESCRPPKELPFIVAGSSPGGFHLLMARQERGYGVGGDIFWRDSIWNHDQINLSGMMFEVAPDAVQFSTLSSSWTSEGLKIFVKDFQNFLIRKFGSIEVAWSVAFDLDGSGSINFTEFGLGCKSSGYVGNATRLWAALDEDRSGEISLDELNTGMAMGILRSITGETSDGVKRLSLLNLVHAGEKEIIEEIPGAVQHQSEGTVQQLSESSH